MRGARHLLLLASALPVLAHAQLDRRKVLSMSLGGGYALSGTSTAGMDTHGSGACVSFAFDFGISPRWGLGLQFERVALSHGVLSTSGHSTLLALIGNYAVRRDARSLLLLQMGYGRSVVTLFDKGARLPADATGGALSLGPVYRRQVHRAMDVQGSLLLLLSGPALLDKGGDQVVDGSGRAISVAWTGLLASVAVGLRF